MRIPTIILLLYLSACAARDGTAHADAAQATWSGDASPSGAVEPAVPVSTRSRQVGSVSDDTHELGRFAGLWQSCNGGASPETCSRYQLLQQGDRVCGLWSYVATGDLYEGRVIAKALSATRARRIRVCGRLGSETQTGCDDGWDVIDKPLHLCHGRLGDLEGETGTCLADFERVRGRADWQEVLMAQPWMKACLAGSHTEKSDDQPSPADGK